MRQIVDNMMKTVSKNTRSRTAIEKKINTIYCNRIRTFSPKENSWTCDNCNNEINGGEECFTCMGCGKAYHDLCQPEEEETLCIPTQEANLKNPQLT